MTRRTPQARGRRPLGATRSFVILSCVALTAACASSPRDLDAGSGASTVPPTTSSGDPSATGGSPSLPSPSLPSLPPLAAALVGLPGGKSFGATRLKENSRSDAFTSQKRDRYSVLSSRRK